MLIFRWKIIAISLMICTTAYSQSNKPKLAEQSVKIYIQHLKDQFNIEPSEFIIETEQTSLFDGLPRQLGNCTILVQTTQELKQRSADNMHQTIVFFTLDIEQTADNYTVDILNDGILCTPKDGLPSFFYNPTAAGRACELSFDLDLDFQSIDCLLLPTDPGK